MATPIVTDVFKFVAVRPVQLKTDEQTSALFIRDARILTSDGKQQLTRLARSLAQKESAVQQFAAADLSPIEMLADRHAALTQEIAVGTNVELLNPGDLLARVQSKLPAPNRIQQATEFAWDILYTAYATGPDAGPRLDGPTAALRLLHFATLMGEGAIAGGREAAAALSAKPLIPSEIANSLVTDSKPKASTGVRSSVREPQEGPIIKGLVDDYVATSRVLASARAAAAVARPEPQWTELGEEDRTHLSTVVSTIPRLGDVAPAELMQQAVLNRASVSKDTALPVAINRLQAQASMLAGQIHAYRDDPALSQQLQALSFEPGVADLISIMGPIPYVSGAKFDTPPDVDVTGMIRPLGIGDLKVVKQKLLAYEPGEVAHVENVLKGETKQRIHRSLNRNETTVFSLDESSEETERDTQSTDRFELKKEAEKTIKEDMSIAAGLVVTGGFGPVTITAHGDFAYSTSQTESNKNSSNFARDVVDRSVSKVQKRTKTERTSKTFHEAEETNTHGVDNVDGPGHIAGVYRWVDKRYRAQVYNYGRRLMFEFVIPEPAAYLKVAQRVGEAKATADLMPPAPFLDLNGKPLSAQAITETNYSLFASRYNAAGVVPPPPEWTSLSTGIEQNAIADGQTFSKSVKDIVAPAGYRMIYYVAQLSAVWRNYPHLTLQVGDNRAYLLKNLTALRGGDWEVGWAQDPGDWDNPNAAIPITVMGYDINAYAVNITVNFQRTEEARAAWQLQTFDKIYTAYKALKTEYDQKMTQSDARSMSISMSGRNPQMNLEIIKRELKKLCLTMMTGKHWNDFDAMSNPSNAPVQLPEIEVYEALKEGPIIQFFEQAFDWEQITYLFYPYFWGRKSKWIELSNETDPDPLFMHFLQAGAARVVVPVSPAYNHAILYFLQAKSPNLADKIWMGGEPPTIDDPLYKSIADEIQSQTDDLAGAVPEGDPWEFTVPTTLIWLQPGPELPTFS